MTTFFQDLRYAARSLRKSPGFALVAIPTLALAIGANTAVFSFVHAALLRALPYPSPERLVVVGDAGGRGSVDNVGFTTFQDLRDGNRTFATLAAIRSWLPTLAEKGEAERLPAMRVSWNYFAMLGVRPALGREFLPQEDRPETWRVLLLSDSLWRRRFGADPGVLGRTVRMNDRDFRIVGVLPASFEPLVSARYYKPAQLWAPLGYDATLPYACRSCQHLKVLGRLRAGVTAGQARADLDRIRGRLAAEHPTDYPAGGMGVVPLREELSGGARPALLVVLAAVGFVLLIACANVANLLLARALRRTREIAIRSALGAGRWRLIQQLLAESLLLAAAGGAAGIAVAAAALQGLSRLAPVSLPRLDQVGMDPRVLGFAALVSLTTGLLFGLAPALRLSRPDLRGPLAADSTSVAGGSAPRARKLLVAANLALALMLLAGAGLMLKTLGRLLRVDPGFRPDRVLALQFSLVGDAYAQDPAVVAFQDHLLERVRALLGVEAAALAGQIPLGGNGDRFGFHVEGRVTANPAEDPSAERYSVTPDYFRVMGIALERGRLFTGEDRASAVPVMVVSETTARQLFRGEDPLGRRVRIGDINSGPWRTIVGIAADVRHSDIAEVPTPQMYLPQAQVTDSYLVLTVKAATPRPEALAGPIRGVLRDLDPGVPIFDVATMRERVGNSVAARRFVARLLAGFAGLAVILAAIGLYGVISYALGQRTREIGVRVALGASRADILRLVLGSAVFTVIAGLIAGLAGTLTTTRLLRTLLFDVSPHDPATLALAVVALAAVALAAHWLPARRAARIDPMVALRSQ
jgi:putative ABC transport system permease protein